MQLIFLKCETCGQIFAVVKCFGRPVTCCGKPMTPLSAQSTELAFEKHVPVVKEDHGIVKVKVGADEHPMTEAHHIEWIGVQTSAGFQIKFLEPGQDPKARFHLAKGETFEAAYAYCNLHSLWVTPDRAKGSASVDVLENATSEAEDEDEIEREESSASASQTHAAQEPKAVECMNINEGVSLFHRTPKALLIDVRESSEYVRGHIPGALSVPMARIQTITEIAPNKATPLFIYCMGGIEAKRATVWLLSQGYTNALCIGAIWDYTGVLENA